MHRCSIVIFELCVDYNALIESWGDYNADLRRVFSTGAARGCAY